MGMGEEMDIPTPPLSLYITLRGQDGRLMWIIHQTFDHIDMVSYTKSISVSLHFSCCRTSCQYVPPHFDKFVRNLPPSSIQVPYSQMTLDVALVGGGGGGGVSVQR